MTRSGVSVYGSRVLEVQGRKSGEWRQTPVNLLSDNGADYLVAPRGQTQWVKNLRASGTGRLRVGRRTESFVAVELPDEEKPAVLRAYLKKWKFEVGVFFAGVGPDSSDDELRRISPDHPVFRLSRESSKTGCVAPQRAPPWTLARRRSAAGARARLSRTPNRQGSGDHRPLLGREGPHHGRRGGDVDYLKTYGNFGGGGTEVALFVIALVLQFAVRHYQAFAYWFLAYAIAISGTGFADFLHLDVHISYAGTTILWVVILAAVFWTWKRNEGTLSIHSVTTQRREAFYWATVFATFALGTALGDFTASSLDLGYLDSGIFFLVLILVPALAWWRFGLNSIAAFWMAYVVTRPLGASFADYISKPRSITGIGFGDGSTALVFTLAVVALVSYLVIARPDVRAEPPEAERPASGTAESQYA